MNKVNNLMSKILMLIIVIISGFLIINIFKNYEGFNSKLTNAPNNELIIDTNDPTINNYVTPSIQNFNDNLYDVYNTTSDISNNLYKYTNQINYKLNDISDNMFSDYDASKNFYNSSGNMIAQILTQLNDLSLKIDTTTNLKCIADFGTQRGEKLSSGNGVLTSTEYVCPEEMPSCTGMICGEKYGVCTKT